MNNIAPLNIKISRCVIDGQFYDLFSYDEYAKMKEYYPGSAVLEEFNGNKIILPIRENYTSITEPGIYRDGCIDFVVYPTEENISNYIPETIIELSNTDAMKDILQRKDTLSRLDEPWITSPDNITIFNICKEDKAEMRCLKTAMNKKEIDIDKYGKRFGDNFPNDKRQLRNNSATLNIIKRFCKHLDMEALLTLRDKNPNVPNPMNCEITVSLTEPEFSDDDEIE